jgi:hypothetical protein
MKSLQVVFLILTCGCVFAQEKFPDSCSSGATPHFPSSTATAIDSQCGVDGSPAPDHPGEAPQNRAKNNFCAAGDKAKPISLAEITSLQKEAETKEKANHFVAGEPPKSRDFLEQLGEGNLVVFEGFVFHARQECKETVNCGAVPPNKNASHDIHIALLEEPRKTKSSSTKAEQDREECTGFVAEMIPHHRPAEWTACNVNTVAEQGLRVRVTGQQFFDGSHLPCKNGVPQGSNPKRVSLWEIHPIYSFEVCPSGNCENGGWQTLEQFAAGKTDCPEADCKVKQAASHKGPTKKTKKTAGKS